MTGSVHSVCIQTVFYGLCLIIKYILSYLIRVLLTGNTYLWNSFEGTYIIRRPESYNAYRFR